MSSVKTVKYEKFGQYEITLMLKLRDKLRLLRIELSCTPSRYRSNELFGLSVQNIEVMLLKIELKKETTAKQLVRELISLVGEFKASSVDLENINKDDNPGEILALLISDSSLKLIPLISELILELGKRKEIIEDKELSKHKIDLAILKPVDHKIIRFPNYYIDCEEYDMMVTSPKISMLNDLMSKLEKLVNLNYKEFKRRSNPLKLELMSVLVSFKRSGDEFLIKELESQLLKLKLNAKQLVSNLISDYLMIIYQFIHLMKADKLSVAELLDSDSEENTNLSSDEYRIDYSSSKESSSQESGKEPMQESSQTSIPEFRHKINPKKLPQKEHRVEDVSSHREDVKFASQDVSSHREDRTHESGEELEQQHRRKRKRN